MAAGHDRNRRRHRARGIAKIAAAACLVLCAATGPVRGAEAGSETPAGTERGQNDENHRQKQSDDKQAPPDNGRNGNDAKARDQEIFRPSEEISEDFAVSFPVDI